MEGWPSRWWEPGCEESENRRYYGDDYITDDNYPTIQPGETWIPDEIIIELPFD